MKQGKVILADGHQNMLAGERTLLESMFANVFMVADEASLIEAAERLSPDLIIADLSLPVSRDVNVARRLKKAFPGIRVIVLSVHDEGTAVGECLEAGAVGFVLKRTAVNDLAVAIETILKGGVYVSPAVKM